MAIHASGGEPDVTPEGRHTGWITLPILALATALYGSALFASSNLILDLARAGWQKIHLIEGSFFPSTDAQHLYQSASTAKAVGGSGESLPELTTDSKMRPYDGRIIEQAAQERQLRGPDTFKSPPSS